MKAVSRRVVLQTGLAAGAVFVIGCGPEAAAPPPHTPAPPPTSPPTEPASTTTFSPSAWIRIAPDGIVTVVVDKSEMGQGIETSLAMLVAEELRADWSKIRTEFAPVGAEYKNPMFGMQGTGGSTSIRGSWGPLRTAAAAAREMLVAAAASTWGVDASTCIAQKGEVVHQQTNRRVGYGSLTTKAAAMPVPKSPTVMNPFVTRAGKVSGFSMIGTGVTRIDGTAKATGAAEFGIDVRRPGMLIALVARCPVFGGKAAGFDAGAASGVPGVKKVLATPNGIAVVAENFYAARNGVKALAVRWDEGPGAASSSEKLAAAAAALAKKPGVVAETKGDVEKALAAADKKIEAVYEVPYQAHATMEPQSCTAEVRKDGCDIWVGTQFQEATRGVAAKITGLAPESIAVHTTYLGGGFGRRSEMDFVVDAVSIAKEMPGTPVKVVFTREDDMRHDFYRPGTYNVLRGGVGKDGKPVAWSHRIVGPSIMTRVFPSMVKGGIDHSSVEGAIELPYAVPNVHVDYHMHDTGVPVGFWRSVGNSQNAFIKESFLDELCALTKKDPFAFRKSLMTGAPRLLAVLELAAEKAGWGSALPKGKGRGIAAHASFGSFVAQVAEVTVSPDGNVKVDRVVCAIDCGTVVNPDTVEAQMQGAIVMGLTAALKSEITIAAGKVAQGNFDNFKLLRMNEMPVVEVHIVPSIDPPGGCGEPGTPPIAPAVTNAIFAATGTRIRKLPVKAASLKT